MVPDGARILRNRHGSAPGIWLEDDESRWVAMLPGVPREMKGMLADTLLPIIVERMGGITTVVRSRTLRTTGIAESALAEQIADIVAAIAPLSVAYLPGAEGVDLRLTSRDADPVTADRRLDEAGARLLERVGDRVYGEDNADLAAVVIAECRARGFRIAFGESCTGGLLGGRLTAVPGSSAVVIGGVVAYADHVKTNLLGVTPSDLATHGAVSEAVVRAMAIGARARFGTEIGIGVTGIAGPGGGTAEKPVGTVWTGVDVQGAVTVLGRGYPGDREEIRARAAQAALDLVRRALAATATPQQA
jgi:nicotinamide-nucleotide amidase